MNGIQEYRPNRIANRGAARLARRDNLAALLFYCLLQEAQLCRLPAPLRPFKGDKSTHGFSFLEVRSQKSETICSLSSVLCLLFSVF